MSGAVRAAWCAHTVVGTRCETDIPAPAVATPHRAPRAVPTGTTTVPRRAHVSLVMPTSAATSNVASAAVGQVSGSSGAADAGVC
jgi:hypothetical protein